MVIPSDRYRQLAEVGPDNRTYSAYTQLGVLMPLAENAMRRDIAQVYGARSDIEIVDRTELITFFNENSSAPPYFEMDFKPFDIQAQKASNMFGPGFKFK